MQNNSGMNQNTNNAKRSERDSLVDINSRKECVLHAHQFNQSTQSSNHNLENLS